MKVFVSSLITGMEPFRAAARGAITSLGHQAVMAEDFPVQPRSPQVACLSGVRESALVVLILGGGYGAVQASGLSATHEEYREARDTRPVIAFVQEGVEQEPAQAEFVREVQGWQGLFRGGFKDPEQLRGLITRAIHEWELANAAGPIDAQEILGRALRALPETQRGYGGLPTELAVSIACGPAQAILRPSEIEQPALAEEVMQAALFGSVRIFSPKRPTTHEVRDHALVVEQERGGRVSLSATGDLLLRMPIEQTGFGPIVIEENVIAQLKSLFAFADWVLEKVDPTHRITHVAIAASFVNAEMLVWRTEAEQKASPNAYSMGSYNQEKGPAHMTPPHRPRAALRHDAERLVEDFVALLRRIWK